MSRQTVRRYYTRSGRHYRTDVVERDGALGTACKVLGGLFLVHLIAEGMSASAKR